MFFQHLISISLSKPIFNYSPLSISHLRQFSQFSENVKQIFTSIFLTCVLRKVRYLEIRVAHPSRRIIQGLCLWATPDHLLPKAERHLGSPRRLRLSRALARFLPCVGFTWLNICFLSEEGLGRIVCAPRAYQCARNMVGNWFICGMEKWHLKWTLRVKVGALSSARGSMRSSPPSAPALPAACCSWNCSRSLPAWRHLHQWFSLCLAHSSPVNSTSYSLICQLSAHWCLPLAPDTKWQRYTPVCSLPFSFFSIALMTTWHKMYVFDG